MIESRPRGDKHLLCKDADTELIFMQERIQRIRAIIPGSHYHMLGFTPIDKSGSPVPAPPTSRLIQKRMDDMEKTVLHVSCYVKLHAQTAGIPDVDFDGRVWLKDFLKQWRKVQRMFRGLVEDVVYQMITLFVGVGLDAAQHASFYTKYQKTITGAMEAIKCALPPSDKPHVQSEFCAYFIQRRFRQYIELPPMQRLVPDASSLSERVLVQRFAQLFEINLKRWDRCHGVRLPQVRRILEVFAYDMERKYNEGIYTLTPLFSMGVTLRGEIVDRAPSLARCDPEEERMDVPLEEDHDATCEMRIVG